MSDLQNETFTQFGEMLRYLRLRARLSQRALGQEVGYTGAHVTRLESGERYPDPLIVRARFIDALNLRHEPELAERLIELASASNPVPPIRKLTTSASFESPGQHGPDAKTVAHEKQDRWSSPMSTQRLHGAALYTNLPVQLTSFVGREREIEQVTQLLAKARLLTLTGAGGTGKTRLAIEVGARLSAASDAGDPLTAREFFDGVWLIELAPLSNPSDVPRAVKEALRLPDELGRTSMDILIDHLSGQHSLLILDNCEHIILACAQLVDALLSSCPHLHILATSREILQCPGEMVWRVPSLQMPDGTASLLDGDVHEHLLKQAQTYEAIQLFVDRATAASPDFRLTSVNAMMVIHICARLDGIPLAIEMAAVQTAAMSVQEIESRLDDRFALLTNGRRTSLPRQRTLRALLDWSYNLLTENERILLSRLAVFVDGCTAELAQAVCADDYAATGAQPAGRTGGQQADIGYPDSVAVANPGATSVILRSADILPLLISLVSKSLVVADMQTEHTRYRLLETVRQYAMEKQEERDDTVVRVEHQRLAEYVIQLFTNMTQQENLEFIHDDWRSRLMAELGNVRHLMAWSRTHYDSTWLSKTGLRLACAYANIAPHYGGLAEPMGWLKEGLWRDKHETIEDTSSIRVRANGLSAWLGILMYAGYNLAHWSADADELVAIVDHLDTDIDRCLSFLYQGIAAVGRGDLDIAETIFEQMHAVSKKYAFKFGMGVSLIHQSLARLARQNSAGAAELLGRSFDIHMAPDIPLFPVLRLAGMIWLNTAQALTLIEDSLSPPRTVAPSKDSKGYETGMYWQLCVQAHLCEGRYERAEVCAMESLAVFRTLKMNWNQGFGIAEALLELGRIAWLRDDFGAARDYGEQCLALYLGVGDMEHAAQAHTLIGYAAIGQGDLNSADACLRRGLSLFNELYQQAGIVVAIAGMALLAETRGDIERAARLYGAADAPSDSLLLWLNTAIWTQRLASRVIYDRAMTTARRRYEGTAYMTPWSNGRQMAMEQAIAYAMA